MTGSELLVELSKLQLSDPNALQLEVMIGLICNDGQVHCARIGTFGRVGVAGELDADGNELEFLALTNERPVNAITPDEPAEAPDPPPAG